MLLQRVHDLWIAVHSLDRLRMKPDGPKIRKAYTYLKKIFENMLSHAHEAVSCRKKDD